MSGPSWAGRTLPSSQVANIVCVGDSLTQMNTYCTTPQTWVYLLGGAGAAYGGLGAPSNQGVSGNTIAQMRARKATWNALYDASKAQNILYVMGGTNNIVDSTSIGPTIADLAGLCSDALAAHPWLIYIATIFDAIPRAPNFDAARLIYNAIIHASYKDWGAVGVIDPGKSVGMLASGAPTSPTYFGADQTHPNPAGNTAMSVDEIAALKRTAVYLVGTGGGGGGGAPTVASIDHIIGDAGGGLVVRIQVNSSTGATGATVNGVALTSFSIVDATHVQGTTATMTASATPGDVTVTNGSGTGTLAGAFFAVDTSGMAAWFKGDAGLTLSGSNVTNWADQSGNGNDLNSSSGGTSPTKVSSGLNGLDYVTFNGSSDEIHRAGFAPGGSGDLSMFVVSRLKLNAGYQSIVDYNVLHPSLLVVTATDNESVYAGSQGAQSATHALNVWLYTTVITTATPTEDIYTNGAGHVASAVGGAVASSGILTVGAYNAGANFKFDGDIAEVIVFNKSKASTRTQFEAYLKAKWGL